MADQIGLSVDTMTHDYGVGRLASWLTYPPQQTWWASAVDPRPATAGGMTQRVMIGGRAHDGFTVIMMMSTLSTLSTLSATDFPSPAVP